MLNPNNRTSSERNENPEVDISVLIVNFNTAHLLERLLTALKASFASLNVQVIMVDNLSRDNSLSLVESRFPWVELIRSTSNLGFGRANNLALTRARGRFVLLLNTDAFVSPNSLVSTIAFMEEHPQCGVLGVRLVSETGELQPSCRFFPTPWNLFLERAGIAKFFPRFKLVDELSWDHYQVRACDWVPGCFYLARMEVIRKVGLFDERYFMYSEEVDHCRRVKDNGWQIMFCPWTEVIHLGGESAGVGLGRELDSNRQISSFQIESELLYFRKHGGWTGLLTYFILMRISDLLQAVKGLARTNSRAVKRSWSNTTLSTRLLIDTRFASRSTN